MIRARLVVAVLAVAAASLVGCASTPPAKTPAKTTVVDAPADHVDGASAKKLVADGAKLVDVRSPGEYAEKHIDGAENVPVDTVGDHDFGSKDTPVVVYCGSGKRSGRAAQTLRSKGYTRIYDLGGMSNWDK